MKHYRVDLSKINFRGNLLEINNRYEGIIYNLFKNNNDEIAIDYVEEDKNLDKNFYENIVLFFHMSTMKNEKEVIELLKELAGYMNDEGEIFIWDIEKRRGKIFSGKVEFLLPNDKKKEIIIKDINLTKKFGREQLEKILSPYIEITEKEIFEDIFFIRGKMKGRKINESTTSSDKLQVYSQ